MPDVLGYLFLILSLRVHIVTTVPELSITIFKLQLPKLLISHQTLFPFKYPTNADTLILRCDLILICFRGQLSDRTSFLANQKELL